VVQNVRLRIEDNLQSFIKTLKVRNQNFHPAIRYQLANLANGFGEDGGAAFVPGSIRGLNKGLDELQEVIRSRYLISYKPAMFKHNGHYRSIDISAQKSGRKLRIYARKGYYAGPPAANETPQSR
jgi:hypothetical protein